MKKTSPAFVIRAKALVILAVAGIAASALIVGQTAEMSESLNSSVKKFQLSGATIYTDFCATCHGSDGRSKTAKGKRKNAPDLTKSTISVAKGIRVITNGRNLMPEFNEDLSEEEIRRVNSYVRSLRK